MAQSLAPDAFLELVANGDLAPEDVLAGPEGAAFLTGVHLLPTDRAAAEQYLLLSLQHESPPFAVEAGIILLDADDAQPDTVSDAAADADTTAPDAVTDTDAAAELLFTRFPEYFHGVRAVASYWYDREADAQLAEVLVHLSEFDQARQDAEVVLWQLVNGYRLNGEFSEPLLVHFLLTIPAADEHWRLERYIAFSSDRRDLVGEDMYRLLQHKAAISQRSFRGSAAGLLEEPWPEITAVLLWDIQTAAGQSRTQSATAAQLAEFESSRSADGDLVTAALAAEIAGRLLLQGNRYRESRESFERALSLEPGSVAAGAAGQRRVWNWWRAGIRMGMDTALQDLAQLGEWIQDPPFFHDLLHDLVSRLVRDQRWNDIAYLYTTLDEVLSPGMQARVAWILAEAVQVGAEIDLDRRQLLETAAAQREDPYYSMVAAIALGAPRELPVLDTPPAGSGAGHRYEAEEYRDWARQMYAAELLNEGYRVAHPRAALFSLDEIAGFAAEHHRQQRYIDGMRLLDRAVRVHSPDSTSEDFVRLRYPQAFSDEMATVLSRYELYPPVFYALVREESYFDPGISSWVGAMGLSQLMPATANDMARLLRMEDPDLSDPLTNLKIGGLYYQRLLNRFAHPVQALVAYNAGQGRVNGWRNQPWTDSLVLFHEGVPFEESRHYIRKIFVSAAHYSELYYDGSAEEVFFHIFPDFQPYSVD